MAKNLNVITVTKVKITGFKEDQLWRDQLCGIELGFSEEVHSAKKGFDHVRETPTVKLRNFFAHDDLLTIFRDLGQHMAMICEFKKQEDFEEFIQMDDNYIESTDYSKFSENCYCLTATVTGSHEGAGVMLEGYRILSTGKKLKLQTPNIQFDNTQYDHGKDLSDLMDSLTNEGLKAMQENKRKVVQAELPFEDDKDEKAIDDETSPDAGDFKLSKRGKTTMTVRVIKSFKDSLEEDQQKEQ